jgi:hypothetical protein
LVKRSFARWFVALIVTALVFGQGTWVLAGTTGILAGTVVDQTTNQPVSGVKVTASSPSQTVSTRTDGSGHFVFLALAPDTYSVSTDISSYDPSATSGVTIIADQTRQLALPISKSLKLIGTAKSRSASSLVRPGTTADVYSVGQAQQKKVSAAGGGGNLDSAWSALATVPGVSVLPGQNGYIGAGASISIRGGDYDQIGYQIDGVPVNRAFDNYPSGPVSSLGQQELQVYTGGPPANSTSEGISGYINQVMRTGTTPGFASLDLGIGGPAYYHKASVELGGATPDRRFSYYVGLGGYNQWSNYVDQYNGAGIAQMYGPILGPACGSASASVTPSCYGANGVSYASGAAGGGSAGYVLGNAANLWTTPYVQDRDSVANLHYYIPHKNGTRDDIQALYVNNYLNTTELNSAGALGGTNFLNQINYGTPSSTNPTNYGTPTYIDGYQLNGQTGTLFTANPASLVSNYYFPNTAAHGFGSSINSNTNDGFLNNQAIFKLQYTKSLGTNAIARAYVYTYYSNWLNTGPNSAYANYKAGGPFGLSYDYELASHTRGVHFDVSDQINSQNLLLFGGDWTTSTTVRDNNTQFLNGLSGPSSISSRTAVGVLVDSSNPTNGVCYDQMGTARPCLAMSNGTATGYNYGQYASSGVPGAKWLTLAGLQTAGARGSYVAPSGTCGNGPCEYLGIGNGQYATYNTVQPIFWGASLTDEWRPNSKITVNGGLRLDIYQYQGGNTAGTDARAFWYSAYNREVCQNTTSNLLAVKTAPITAGGLGLSDPSQACPTGYEAVDFQNPSGTVTQTYSVWQPRLGVTYALAPKTVLRASYGRYAQPPNSAFEQYDALQTNSPALLYGSYGFQQYGFNSPNHAVPPATSNNYDLSLEQALGQQFSLKLTPFYRNTQNQIQQFYLNRATNFVSGLNVGNQVSEGLEFEVDKGDLSQQGLSGKLSFTYTNSYIKYNVLSNGSTVLQPVVDAVNAYNALTKAGGGAPCYTTDGNGTPDPTCASTSFVNPYYNSPEQDPGKFSSANKYIPYDTIPAGIGVSSGQYGVPYLASLVLNERIKNFAIAPIVQFFGGQRYSAPLATNGIDPTQCGTPGDVTSCNTLLGGIPDPFTGTFDGLGAFVEPSQLLLHFQLTYDVNKNFGLVANLANVVNTCFGGSNVAWKVTGACSYGLVSGGYTGGIGNTVNPGTPVQPAISAPYQPYWSQQPFGIYVNANFKL